MEKNLKNGGEKGLVTPSTALLNQRRDTFSKPRMLTEYEIKLLRQSKIEIAEAIRKMDEFNNSIEEISQQTLEKPGQA